MLSTQFQWLGIMKRKSRTNSTQMIYHKEKVKNQFQLKSYIVPIKDDDTNELNFQLNTLSKWEPVSFGNLKTSTNSCCELAFEYVCPMQQIVVWECAVCKWKFSKSSAKVNGVLVAPKNFRSVCFNNLSFSVHSFTHYHWWIDKHPSAQKTRPINYSWHHKRAMCKKAEPLQC